MGSTCDISIYKQVFRNVTQSYIGIRLYFHFQIHNLSALLASLMVLLISLFLMFLACSAISHNILAQSLHQVLFQMLHPLNKSFMFVVTCKWRTERMNMHFFIIKPILSCKHEVDWENKYMRWEVIRKVYDMNYFMLPNLCGDIKTHFITYHFYHIFILLVQHVRPLGIEVNQENMEHPF